MSNSRLPRWLLWTLAMSLCANLFLIGAIVGYRTGNVAPPPSLGAEHFVERIRALPAEDRIRLGLALRRHRAELAAAAVEVRRAAEETSAVLGAAPYDPQRMEAAFASLKKARSQRQAAMQAALLDVLPQLSDAGRRSLALPIEARRDSGR